MAKVLVWVRNCADGVAVALLTAMFATFIIQIVSRYVLDAPVGWSVEVCLTTWLWVVFWDAAFGLADRDHVKFDIFYHAAGDRIRRIMAIISALAIAGGLLVSLPATYGFISFYRIKNSATLEVRLDYVFSIYGIFAVAVIVRYAGRIVVILRNGVPEEPGHDDALTDSDGIDKP